MLLLSCPITPSYLLLGCHTATRFYYAQKCAKIFEISFWAPLHWIPKLPKVLFYLCTQLICKLWWYFYTNNQHTDSYLKIILSAKPFFICYLKLHFCLPMAVWAPCVNICTTYMSVAWFFNAWFAPMCSCERGFPLIERIKFWMLCDYTAYLLYAFKSLFIKRVG